MFDRFVLKVYISDSWEANEGSGHQLQNIIWATNSPEQLSPTDPPDTLHIWRSWLEIFLLVKTWAWSDPAGETIDVSHFWSALLSWVYSFVSSKQEQRRGDYDKDIDTF